jgi:OFA family oxalate/formate antiporter-like MFS transporter
MSPDTATPPTKNRGWIVTFSGLGINLALGILYAWSLIKGKIGDSFGWDKERLNDPYAACCLVFAFAMILAGRCQDKFGPRLTASIGGILVGLGFFIASRTTDYWMWVIGFGVLAGMGIGFGYSSATPPALKWFPPAKTGIIAGMVVAGFGLAPVYLAPLTEYLMKSGEGHAAVLHTMTIYSVFFTVVVVGLAQMLVNPPAGYVAATKSAAAAKPAAVVNFTPGEILRQPTFYLLWVIYFIGSGAGLMVIGSISGMARKSMGTLAFVAVAVMAIGNAGGRILAGTLSDRIGRRWTLCLVLGIQAALMFVAIPVTASKDLAGVIIVVLAALIGANYGANLALFPAFTKDLWGLKSFGMNYGTLFTAWGVGGFVLPRLQQMLTARSDGSYTSSFITAGVLLLAGGALTFLIKSPSQAGPAPAPLPKPETAPAR